MGLHHLAFFLLLFVPLTKKATQMDRNALLGSFFLPTCHTPDLTNFVSKSTCPIVQVILLWNVLGTNHSVMDCAGYRSHSVMECAGYKPFCYGVCWVPKRPH